MPHDPNDPITIRGGSVEVEIPALGVQAQPRRNNHHVFHGHTPQDHITKIVIKRANGSIAFQSDDKSVVEKCTIEVFFSHP